MASQSEMTGIKMMLGGFVAIGGNALALALLHMYYPIVTILAPVAITLGIAHMAVPSLKQEPDLPANRLVTIVAFAIGIGLGIAMTLCINHVI